MKSARFHDHEVWWISPSTPLPLNPKYPADFMMPNEPRTNGPTFLGLFGLKGAGRVAKVPVQLISR